MNDDDDEYKNRKPSAHIDGTPIFQTREDRINEDAVARTLEKHFGCEIRSFGALAVLDRYAVRGDRLVGVLEIKARGHATNAYPTVYLSVRKWFALIMAPVGLGVPGIFVVRFTDQIRWIRANDVDGTKHLIVGTRRIAKSPSDKEPMIKVPVAAMTALEERKTTE